MLTLVPPTTLASILDEAADEAKELPKRSYYNFTAAAGDVITYDPRTGQTKRTPPKRGSKVSLNPVYKDMLSLTLAGVFQLLLYVFDVPNLQSEAELKAHFKTLPKDCFMLLEDIDCVGSVTT
ncbi:hypothetical protein PG984_002975 [Apiospora sp. TS-2023a]